MIVLLSFIYSYLKVANLDIAVFNLKVAEGSRQSNSFDQFLIDAIENTRAHIGPLSKVDVIYSRVLAKCEETRCTSVHLIVGTQAIPIQFLSSGDTISAVTEYGFDLYTQTYSARTWSHPIVNNRNLISLQDMEVGLTQAFNLIISDESVFAK